MSALGYPFSLFENENRMMNSKASILGFLAISVLGICFLFQLNSEPFLAVYIRSPEFAALQADSKEYCDLNSIVLTPSPDLHRVSIEFTALDVKSCKRLVRLIDVGYRNRRVDFVVKTKNKPETHKLSGLNESSFQKPLHSN